MRPAGGNDSVPTRRGGLPVRVDAVRRDFDFGNASEGEQKSYEVYRWLFRSLFHNVSNSVGDRGLEHYALGLNAGKVHTHELARLEHHACMKILPLREVKCKPFPTVVKMASRGTMRIASCFIG
jgi:hypothetical protein